MIETHCSMFDSFQGILDIVLTTYSGDKKYHTHLLEQDLKEDANFLKIMGICIF